MNMGIGVKQTDVSGNILCIWRARVLADNYFV